jgi:DNA-binding NarL/FixJ family response regulator
MRELSVAEQRYQAVMAVIADGLTICQVAEKVGVSRQTLGPPVLPVMSRPYNFKGWVA